MIRPSADNFTWHGVDIHPYKEDGGTHFKSITRQTLAPAEHDLPVELRYFEMAADGYSTMERHDHSHLVMIIRGSGEVMVGETVTEVGVHDVVRIPPQTWHQFRATKGTEFGFLCVVNEERDRPHRPTEEEVAELRQHPVVGPFFKV